MSLPIFTRRSFVSLRPNTSTPGIDSNMLSKAKIVSNHLLIDPAAAVFDRATEEFQALRQTIVSIHPVFWSDFMWLLRITHMYCSERESCSPSPTDEELWAWAARNFAHMTVLTGLLDWKSVNISRIKI